eukprot:4128566-Pleurochrysis_carterae.AAC.1
MVAAATGRAGRRLARYMMSLSCHTQQSRQLHEELLPYHTTQIYDNARILPEAYILVRGAFTLPYISHRMSEASYSYLVLLLVHTVAAGARSPAAALPQHATRTQPLSNPARPSQPTQRPRPQ